MPASGTDDNAMDEEALPPPVAMRGMLQAQEIGSTPVGFVLACALVYLYQTSVRGERPSCVFLCCLGCHYCGRRR